MHTIRRRLDVPGKAYVSALKAFGANENLVQHDGAKTRRVLSCRYLRQKPVVGALCVQRSTTRRRIKMGSIDKCKLLAHQRHEQTVRRDDFSDIQSRDDQLNMQQWLRFVGCKFRQKWREFAKIGVSLIMMQ